MEPHTNNSKQAPPQRQGEEDRQETYDWKSGSPRYKKDGWELEALQSEGLWNKERGKKDNNAFKIFWKTNSQRAREGTWGLGNVWGIYHIEKNVLITMAGGGIGIRRKRRVIYKYRDKDG